MALGSEITALLTRDEQLSHQLMDAAQRTGDPLWPLPWARRYIDQVRLSPTTVRNHPLQATGRAITAALFLGEFVPEGIRFAHLDVGGSGWAEDTSTGIATAAAILLLTAALSSAG